MALTNASLTQGSSVTTTNNVITGTGVFDDLMESVTAHLEAQFQLGRITGTDFATVYLGAMQSALQASVSYTLGQEKTNADVVLIGKQGLKVDADKLLVDAQELLTDNQAATELKKALDIVNTTTNRSASQATSENTAIKQRVLLEKQALDTVSSTSLKDAQELLTDAQKLKTDQEKALLLQKQTTEYAQTLVTGNNTPNANSILGKDITLKGEQSKGFKWNADQKYLKTLMDAWTVNTNISGTASTTITALNATGTGNLNTQITNAEPTG